MGDERRSSISITIRIVLSLHRGADRDPTPSGTRKGHVQRRGMRWRLVYVVDSIMHATHGCRWRENSVACLPVIDEGSCSPNGRKQTTLFEIRARDKCALISGSFFPLSLRRADHCCEDLYAQVFLVSKKQRARLCVQGTFFVRQAFFLCRLLMSVESIGEKGEKHEERKISESLVFLRSLSASPVLCRIAHLPVHFSLNQMTG